MHGPATRSGPLSVKRRATGGTISSRDGGGQAGETVGRAWPADAAGLLAVALAVVALASCSAAPYAETTCTEAPGQKVVAAPAVPASTESDNAESWKRIVADVRRLRKLLRAPEPSPADIDPLLEGLGIDEREFWAFLGRVVIASDEAPTVVVPDGPVEFPDPTRGLYLCRGDVSPEPGEEIVLGLGRCSPWQGSIHVYSADLRKLASVECWDVISVELLDLAYDARREIVVREDMHQLGWDTRGCRPSLCAATGSIASGAGN